MSDAAPEEAPKKKGGMKKKLMLIVGILVLVGAGVGGGVYASGAGLIGGQKEGEAEDPNKPKLVPKGDGHVESKGEGGADVKVGEGKHAAPGEKVIDPSKYEATYYPIEQPFTSNMRDTDGFMQVGLGFATYYDQKVIDNVTTNLMPIRSAILMVLADQDSFSLQTPDGKKLLQKQLKDAVNQVLVSREGFGGIDDVYFTSFIIQ